ncbi:uncharacterized protein LOC136033039 isoform X2 [Artemia franciscana]|uniref:Uncharacterized protein n=1 Tax=Artemia franciscana TaxID=6661 RepID=A0AA88I925_ARTSF|nr:hypothetical protein QYM36_001334 [Artemia franciscana]
MGKKGRRTKWRMLSMGDSSGPEDEEDEGVVLSNDGTWRETPPYLRSSSGGSGPGSLSPDFIREGRRGPRYSSRDGYTCPVRTQCKTFGNEEYTIISTPRQEVMFKKGSIAKKKSEQNDTRPPSSLTEEETHLNQDLPACPKAQQPEDAPELYPEPPQPFMCYPVSYDVYGNIVPCVPYGSQYPVLPTVMLQPMQWYDKPPGEQVYYYALMYPTPMAQEDIAEEDEKTMEEDESYGRRGSASSQAFWSSSVADQDSASISSPGISQGPSSPQNGSTTPCTDSVSPKTQEDVPLADFARLSCNVSIPPPVVAERPQLDVPPPPPQAGYVYPSYKTGPPSGYTMKKKHPLPVRHRSPPSASGTSPPKHQQPWPPMPLGLTRRQRRNRKKRRGIEENWETECSQQSSELTTKEVSAENRESQTVNQNSSSLHNETNQSDTCTIGHCTAEKLVDNEMDKDLSEPATPLDFHTDVVGNPCVSDSNVIDESESIATAVVVSDENETEISTELTCDEVDVEVIRDEVDTSTLPCEETLFQELTCEDEVDQPVFDLELPDDLPFDPAELIDMGFTKPLEGWGCVDLGVSVISSCEKDYDKNDAENEKCQNHFLGYTEQGDATTLCSSATENLCSSIADCKMSCGKSLVATSSVDVTAQEPIKETSVIESEESNASTPEVRISSKCSLSVFSLPASSIEVVQFKNNKSLDGSDCAPGVETLDIPSDLPNSRVETYNGLHKIDKLTFSSNPLYTGAQLRAIDELNENVVAGVPMTTKEEFNSNIISGNILQIQQFLSKSDQSTDSQMDIKYTQLQQKDTPTSCGRDNLGDETSNFSSVSGTPYHSLFPTPAKEMSQEDYVEQYSDEPDSLEKSRTTSISGSFEEDLLEEKDEFGEEILDDLLYEKQTPRQLWRTVILEETENETTESDNYLRTDSNSINDDIDEVMQIHLEEGITDEEPFGTSNVEFENCKVNSISQGFIEKGTITKAVAKWLEKLPQEDGDGSVMIESESSHSKNEEVNPRTAPLLEYGPQRRVDESEEVNHINCSPARYSQYYQLGVVMSDDDEPRDSGVHTETSSLESEKPIHKTNSLRKRLKSTLRRSTWKRNSRIISAEIDADEIPFDRLKRGKHCCALQ